MGRFFLLGHPLGHSLSLPLQRFLFNISKTKARYGLLDVPEIKLYDTIDFLKQNADGFNVTIPYKQRILPFLDDIHPFAKALGAVNTVKVSNGRLTGFNTDADGFDFSLDHYGIICNKRRAAVLGAGGVSRMMAAKLLQAGAYVDIAARDISKAHSLSKELEEKGFGTAGTVDIKDFKKGYDLIFNGTPAGMYPHTEKIPIKAETLDGAEAVFDTIYNPIRTKLLDAAQMVNAKGINGLLMLSAQAAAAQTIWTGKAHEKKDILRAAKPLAASLSLMGKNLVFWGMPGSGKTTLGQRAALEMGYDFYDIDDEIVKETGMSVTDIFKNYGEKYFRNIEKNMAISLSEKKRAVISTGGGTVTDTESVAALKRDAVTVFINPPLSVLENRLKDDRSRPLLSGENAAKKLAELYGKREKFYTAADIFIDNKDIESTMDMLYEQIEKREVCGHDYYTEKTNI